MRRFSLNELSAYLNRCATRTKPTVARSLTDEAYETLAATIPVTPIEFGPLRASGRVSPPALLGSSIGVEIRFGGPAAGYAIYVHEIVVRRDTGRKVFHQSPTKAKFLSSTAEGRMDEMMAGVFVRSVSIFKGR